MEITCLSCARQADPNLFEDISEPAMRKPIKNKAVTLLTATVPVMVVHMVIARKEVVV